MRTLTASLLLLLALGCEPPCEDSCADVPPTRQVVGTPADFSLGPQSRDGVTISAPFVCEIGSDGHGVSVETDGDEPFPDGFLTDVVAPAMYDDSIEPFSWGFGLCGPGAAAWIAIDDWGRADDAVRIIGKALQDGGYAGRIELRVEREVIYCAQAACAF